ncbi:hypothetical protein ACFQX7_00575 [Luedemannella flava]
MMSQADRVACEDVVMFVNAAIASTGQREFRSTAAEQRLSLDFLHEYVLGTTATCTRRRSPSTSTTATPPWS